MLIYPAIDIKDGKSVRLQQGREEDITYYGDPAMRAEMWISAGATQLHVVDLDGAFSGSTVNRSAVQCICSRARIEGVNVQLGGGIRSLADVKTRFDWGVSRIILGTSALENMSFVQRAVEMYPERIVAGIDVRNGFVAIKGWREQSDVKPVDLGKKLYDIGIRTCVYTDIARDGMMSGPNIEAMKFFSEQTGLEIIASGGIASPSDIANLREAGFAGAIVGKALYDRKINLSMAIEVASGLATPQ